MSVEVKIPSTGESISEVRVAEWLKSEGDEVELDESIVEVESDKASLELPAPAGGVLSKILKKSGESCGVGDVIAVIEERSEARKGGGKKPPASADNQREQVPSRARSLRCSPDHPASRSATRADLPLPTCRFHRSRLLLDLSAGDHTGVRCFPSIDRRRAP